MQRALRKTHLVLVGTDGGVADDEEIMLLKRSILVLKRRTSGRYYLILEAGYGVDDGIVEYVKGVLHRSVPTNVRTWDPNLTYLVLL